MRWYSTSDPSQYTTRFGLVSFAALSTQVSSGVATLILPASSLFRRHSLCYASALTQAALDFGFAILLRAQPNQSWRELASLWFHASRLHSWSKLTHVTLDPKLDYLRVVLVEPRNPLNIGAAARAMSNFGFFHLRVVNPYDLAFREARSAVGASQLLETAGEFKNVGEAVADCTLVVGTSAVGRRQPQHPVRSLEKAAPLLRKRLATCRVALLFGSEKRGLSNEDLSHCHWLLRIPTRDEHRSMNLGQAVSVCLYELARGRRALAKPEKELPPATSDDLERLTSVLFDALCASGYVKMPFELAQKPRSAAPTEEKIRRLIRRLHISAADAELALGIFRQILWKSRQDNKPSQ